MERGPRCQLEISPTSIGTWGINQMLTHIMVEGPNGTLYAHTFISKMWKYSLLQVTSLALDGFSGANSKYLSHAQVP